MQDFNAASQLDTGAHEVGEQNLDVNSDVGVDIMNIVSCLDLYFRNDPYFIDRTHSCLTTHHR